MSQRAAFRAQRIYRLNLVATGAGLLFASWGQLGCRPEEAPAPRHLAGGLPDVLLPPSDEPECAVPDALTLPASLFVSVLDEEGAPLEGARVLVAGHGGISGPDGAVSFLQLDEGELAITVTSEDGAQEIRALTLVPGGLHRVEVRVDGLDERVSFGASEGLSLDEGDLWLDLDPDALEGVDGAPAEGELSLDWSRVTDSDGQGIGVGSGIGVDASGARVHLSLFSAVTVRASDEDGRPLRFSEGSTLGFSQILDLADAEDECLCMAAWALDPWTGLWTEQPDLEMSAFAVSGELALAADLPRPGIWGFGSAAEPGCLNISLEDCPGLAELPLEVQVSGPDGVIRRALSLWDPAPRFEDLGAGEVEVALLSNDVELYHTFATISEGGVCAELQLAPSVCEGAVVAVQTDDACPAEAASLRLSERATGRVSMLSADKLAVLPDLGAGVWDLALLGSAGETLDSAELSVSPGTLATAQLEAPGMSAAAPPGGCAEAPCNGSSCDACLLLELFDEDGAPADGATIDVCEPVDDTISTDISGEVCLDVPDGAGLNLTVAPEGGWMAMVPLSATGDCSDPERCARRGTNATSVYSCETGWTAFGMEMDRLDRIMPGRTSEALVPDTWGLDASRLSLTWEGEEGTSTLSCADDVFATVALGEDYYGVLWGEETVTRCETSEGVGVRLALRWSEEALDTDALTVGADLELTLTLMEGETELGEWVAAEGEVTLLQRGLGRLDLALDLALARTDGDVPEALHTRVHGFVSAPLVSRADAPLSARDLDTSRLSGAFVDVIAPLVGARRGYGPSGQGLLVTTGERDDGPIMCFPVGTSSYVLGVEVAGYLPPMTAHLVGRSRSVQVYRNPSSYPLALVPSALRWLRRDVADDLYRAAGRDPLEIERGGTILGRAVRWDPAEGALAPLATFGAVFLRAPDGSVIHGTPLGSDLRPASSGSYFAFLGVPPVSAATPYILVLKDSSGAQIAEYTQRVAPAAGTAMILGWD